MIEEILLGLLLALLIILVIDFVVLIRLHIKFPKLIQAYKNGILETNNHDLINEFLDN